MNKSSFSILIFFVILFIGAALSYICILILMDMQAILSSPLRSSFPISFRHQLILQISGTEPSFYDLAISIP